MMKTKITIKNRYNVKHSNLTMDHFHSVVIIGSI
jgi:hypothetical protein